MLYRYAGENILMVELSLFYLGINEFLTHFQGVS